MSSLYTATSASEGESILPEVEELSEFHPDELSNLVDIQEELEKLASVGQNVVEEVVSLSTVDDVNVVDHEVTIVADQMNEDISILPEISDINESSHFVNKTSDNHSYNTIMEENLDIGETITIGTPSVCESKVMDNINHSNSDKSKCVSIKPAPTVVPAQGSVSQLKAIRPLLEPVQVKKPILTMAQPKKNVLTKVIFSPNNHAAPDAPIIFGESGGQTIRIVGQNKTIITNSPKTITLAQAREMGLLSPGKIQQFIPKQNKGTVKKGIMMNSNKTVTMMKSSPTKILPLPTTGQLHPIAPSPTLNSLGAAPQKILIRQSPTTLKPGTFSGTILTSGAVSTQGQIMQLPVSQDNANNQIHQIQLPGKQLQYVRLVNSATAVSTASTLEPLMKPEPTLATPVTSKPIPVALSTSITVSNSSQIKMLPLTTVQTLSGAASQNPNSFERVLVSPGLSQLASSRSDAKAPAGNIVMVPAEYVKQYKPLPINHSPPSPPKTTPPPLPPPPPPPPPLLTKVKEVTTSTTPTISMKEIVTPPPMSKSKSSNDPPNGIRPRKPCNCTKSQCLKLYCDCFANGEFCFQCNCNSCFNNLDHEEERQRAIKACLERNPNAFRPKIGKGYIGDERRHNKGCNCKRSGCLKNYCECYEAKIPCSNNCKCVGCRNVEETRDARDKSSNEVSKVNQQTAVKTKLSSELQESVFKPHTFLSNQGARQPFNLMTQEVVEATCQCLLARVEGDKQLTEEVERLILEEFGRCLVEIIECATRTTMNNAT